MAASNRWLAIIGGVIALAVIAGIAVTTFAGGERQYAEGTPERTVQDYLHAVSNRDALNAASYLAPDLAQRCDKVPRESITNRGSASIRATLDRATVRGDRLAEIHVRITESYSADSPFASGDSTTTQVFLLTQIDGQWRFSEAPWPMYCPPIPSR